MEAWLRSSWQFQQNVFQNVKDRYWDDLEEDSIINNIKFALIKCYGEQYLKTEKNEDLVKNISQQIFKHFSTNKKRYFSCTFLNIWLIDDKKECFECLFWTKHKKTGAEICIDTSCRNYKNWEDFTENNKLPESYIIFPIAGRYANEIGSTFHFKELICQESVACSLKSKFKKFLDVGASVGAIAGVGVLAFNPVSLPVTVTAIAASVVGGIVNTGFAVERLVDNVQHEKTGYHTMFAVSDIVLSAAGAAAVGVTSGCKVLASTEKFLFNSSAMVIKIGNTTTTVCKAMTAVNGINIFIKAIVEYKENGCLNQNALYFLKLTINYIFLISVSLPLVEKLVKYMSRNSLDSIVDSLINQSRTFSYVKIDTSITDLNSLIQRVCPCELPIMKRITDSPVIKFVRKVINNIKQQGTKDPLNLVYEIMNQLPELLKEIDRYFLQSKQQIVNNYGEQTGEFIEKWVLNEGIYIGNEHSSTEDKFSLPGDVINKVNKTLMALNLIENENCLNKKSSLLLDAVMRFIFQHDLKTYNYAIGKANYYCDKFSEIYTKVMVDSFCDLFVDTYKNISDDTKNLVIYGSGGKEIVEFVFNKILILLYESNDFLHNNYELYFQESTHAVSLEGTESVFKFKVPKTDLNEKLCHDTAIKHLPYLSLKLTKDSCKFESHFDQLAIISSNDDNFKLIFYVNEDGEYLDGLLMYIK